MFGLFAWPLRKDDTHMRLLRKEAFFSVYYYEERQDDDGTEDMDDDGLVRKSW